jgi:hypothetical protein
MDSHAFVVNDGEDDATAQIYGEIMNYCLYNCQSNSQQTFEI